MSGPRLAPGGRAEVGLATMGLARVSGLVSGTRPPALFLTLGRHRRLFRGWLRFAGRLMPGGTLPRRETELAILRVAHLRGCAYEWEHHVRLGRRAGVRGDDLDALRAGPEDTHWGDREAALLRAVDELHGGDLSDAGWEALRTHVDERQAIEVLLLVGHYEMLATVIAALRLTPDPPRRRRG